MVLAQFFVANSNNGQWHDININGPCNARLVQYAFFHNNAALIQLQSDVFKTPYSASSSLVVGNNPPIPIVPSRGLLLSNNLVFGFDQSNKDNHWENIVIPGRVQWTVYDVTTGQPWANNSAFTLILTFDIEQLP